MFQRSSGSALVLAAAIFVPFVSSAANPEWKCWGPGLPDPCRNVLNAVSAVPGSQGATVWAAGNGGTVLRGTGATWNAVDTGTRVRLVDIAMADPDLGWAVGDEGRLFGYDGNGWSRVYGVVGGDEQVRAVAAVPDTDPPRAWAASDWMGFGSFLKYDGVEWNESPHTYNGVLKDIEMVGPNNGWAVTSSIGQGVLYQWDGSSWSVFTTVDNPINAISLSRPRNGWAVGDSGGLYHWNGVSWVATEPFTTAYLYGVAAVAPDDVWAVGQCGTLLHWDGSAWEDVPSPVGCIDFHAVAFASSDLGWIVGGSGIILRFDGDEWTPLNSPQLRTVSRIALTPGTTDDLWAVGSGSALLHWINGRWVAVPGDAYSFGSVAMLSPDEGWAQGSRAFYHWDGAQWNRTHDGENTTDMVFTGPGDGWAVGWNTLQHWDGSQWASVPSPVDTTYQAISAAGPGQVWAVGYAAGVMAHYDGIEWTEVEVPDIGSFGGISMVSPDRGYAVGGRWGSGAALEYTGGTWVELGVADDTPDLNAVDVRRFDAGLYGWMVGEEGFARQMRSGQWRDVPTPTDNPLLDVVTVSPDEAWAVGRNGILLHWGAAPFAEPSGALVTATAKLAGQAGTDWRSDLVVTNVGDAATTVTIQAWLRDQANPAPAERTLQLAPMAGEVVEDVLGELFALPSGAAASLLIEAPAPLAIGSRTYNTTVDGTYGQSIPAAALTSAFGPGQPAFVTGLVEGPEARSNLGLVNISDDEITVQAEFFDTGGTALGSADYRVPARGAIQRNRVLRDVVSGTVDAAWARLVSPDGDFMAFGSTVDALTGDPVYRPAHAVGDDVVSGVLQGLARVAGAAGTDWKSELILVNTSEASTSVVFERLIRGQANPQPETVAVPLQPHEVRVIEDVLGELFGMTSGAVSVKVRALESTLISGRTFNQTTDGTYGQLIPVQRRAAAILLGSSGFLVGVTQNDRFRSNLGLTNPLQSEVTVKLRLVDRTGTGVGEDQEIVLSGGEVVQIDRVSELLGVGVIDGGTLVVEPVSGSSVDAFLSIIDGRTGDPVFQVPTVR